MAQVAAELVGKLPAPDALPTCPIPCIMQRAQASYFASCLLATLLCSTCALPCSDMIL